MRIGVVEQKGGPGSGHHGHAGRPGQRGGSAPGNGGDRWQPDSGAWYIVDADSDIWSSEIKEVATLEATQRWADDLHARGWTKEDIDDVINHSYGVFPQFKKRDYPPDWGKSAGSYKAYRTGNVSEESKSGIWFGPDPNELSMYKSVHGNAPILEYTVTLTNPAIFSTKNDIVAKYWPGKPGKRPHREWIVNLTFGKKFKDNPGAANRYIDEQITKKLRRDGYDSLVLLHPELPATREIAVWSNKQVQING